MLIWGFRAKALHGVHYPYHHGTPEHLRRDVGEFDFRYNNRAALSMDDVTRADIALKGIVRKAPHLSAGARESHVRQDILMTHYRLAFNGRLYEQQTNALRHYIAMILERADCESLTILFSSEGGSTDQGLNLYNFIRELPLPIHMHAMGHVGSMALPVFLAGHRRTCTPYARFFFHAYDWGFEGRQMYDRIFEALQRLKSDIDMSRKIIEKHTTIPAEKLDTLYRAAPTPTIFLPPEAKQYRIIHDITELNPTGAKQENVAVWTVDWPSSGPDQVQPSRSIWRKIYDKLYMA